MHFQTPSTSSFPAQKGQVLIATSTSPAEHFQPCPGCGTPRHRVMWVITQGTSLRVPETHQSPGMKEGRLRGAPRVPLVT